MSEHIPPTEMTSQYANRLIGRLVEGRYRVTEHIADGGMGSVYIAHDERLKRDIALKVLRADLAHNPDFVERFRGEAQAAAALNDPHVVSVHDQGQDDDVVFLAMELVRSGRTLRDLIQAGGQTVAASLSIIDDVAAGLACAHRAAIVHRDVKPENVLISDAMVVKVADFGLARAVTATGMSSTSDALIGTAPYLSPEQVSQGVADPRSDVYAVGLILFEMLTGHRAFDGDSPVTIAYQHVNEAMPKVASFAPLLGDAFDPFFAVVCAKDPELRPQNADEFRTALANLRAQLAEKVLRYTSTPGPGTVTSAQSTNAAAPQEVNRTAQVNANVTRVMPSISPEQPRTVGRRTGLIAAGAVLVGLGGAAVAYSQGVFTPKSNVPSVAGMPSGKAISTLRAAGFTVKIQNHESDTVPFGHAITTQPGAQSRIREHAEVLLQVSTGPRQATVPDVKELSYDAAVKKIKDAGFTTVRRHDDFNDRPSGKIVETKPAARSTVSHLTPVVIVVSKGRKEADVPDVVDLDRDEAKKKLQEAGFKVSERTEHSTDVDKDKVISTDPDEGTKKYSGDTVTMTVSSGPEMVTVPDVTGKDAGEAHSILKKAGLKADGGSWTDELFDRKVSSQSPDADTEVEKGSTVELSY